MPERKKILFVGESSSISTGYGVYAKELLTRLHATGRYDLAELAIYFPYDNPRAANSPWPVMPVNPHPGDQAANEVYHGDPTNQFGKNRFEEALLTFQSDYVLDIRDAWMVDFESTSPFRPFYRWIYMSTVDSIPQSEEWLQLFAEADAMLGYCGWGAEVLSKEGRGRLNVVGAAPPGADLDVFTIKADKAGLRRKYGLPPDALVVGTVMRNQGRKCHPDLIVSFAKLLATAPAEIAKNAYLYLHCAWPDLGWDLPRFIKEAGVGGRVYFTYYCRHCGHSWANLFQDYRTTCRKCGEHTAFLATTHQGVDAATLSEIYSIFDVYCQYSTCEGFGIPLAEAGACGVPVLAVDYSAMADVVRKLGGTPIKVQRMFRDAGTQCWRALPDNDHLVAELISLLRLPESARRNKGFLARQGVAANFNWSRTVRTWMDAIELLEPPMGGSAWASPDRRHMPATSCPPGMSDTQFVRWALTHVAGRPDLATNRLALLLSRDLTWGETMMTGPNYLSDLSALGVQARRTPFGRKEVVDVCLMLAEKKNRFEGERIRRLAVSEHRTK